MNYEEFKARVQEELVDYLGAGYEDVRIEFVRTNKVNRSCDAIVLRDLPGMGNASPSVPTDSVFEQYEKTGDFEGVMSSLAENIKDSITRFMETPMGNGLNFDKVDEQIFFSLCNAEQNKEMLANVPHRKFEDLAIIYRWNIANDNEGLYTNIITNEFAEQIGKSEQELYDLANENTKNIFPTTIRNMNDVICDLMFGENLGDDEMKAEFEDIVENTPDERAMYVISNKANMYGAASILYEDKLHELAEKMDSDLYILPSSVHEVIAISDKFGNPEELAEMVYEINMDQVELSDRLSNQVYHYDKDNRTLRLASDSVNKSIADKDTKDISDKEMGKAR